MIHIQLSRFLLAGTLSFATQQVTAVNVLHNAADIPIPSTTLAAEPQLAGTVLVDEVIPFAYNGISGTYQQRVVRSAVDNTIDFYWRITNDSKSTGSIHQFHYLENEANDYGVTYNIGWRSDGISGEALPVKVTRFGHTGLARGGAKFDFFKSDAAIAEGAGIKPGESTPLFFIDTNKTNFVKTAQSTLSSVFIGSSEPVAGYKVTKDSDTNNNGAQNPSFTPVTYENQPIVYQNERLQIPCVEVFNAFGDKTRYQVNMKYTPSNDSELYFELVDAVPAPTKAENCNANYKDGNLNLPLVDVTGSNGAKFKYQVSMSLAPGVANMRFRLTGAQADPSLDEKYHTKFGVIHRLESAANGKTLEVEDGLFNKGVRVQQYHGYSSNGIVDGHNQEWLILPGKIVTDRDGTKRYLVRILNYGFMKYLVAVDENKVQLALPESATSGVGTTVADVDPFIGSLWEIVPTSDGNRIRLRSELNGRFLQTPENNDNGAEMQLAPSNNLARQQFSDVRIAISLVPARLKNVDLELNPTHNFSQQLGFALVTDCDQANRTPAALIALGLDSKNSGGWQGRGACRQFKLKEQFLNIFRINANVLPNYSLQPVLRNTVALSPANVLDNLWIVHDVVREPGKFIIVNGVSGLVLVATNLTTGAEPLVTQALFINDSNQKWSMQLPN